MVTETPKVLAKVWVDLKECRAVHHLKVCPNHLELGKLYQIGKFQPRVSDSQRRELTFHSCCKSRCDLGRCRTEQELFEHPVRDVAHAVIRLYVAIWMLFGAETRIIFPVR